MDSESAQSGIVMFAMGRLERKENLVKFDNDCLEFAALEIATHLLGSEQRVLK